MPELIASFSDWAPVVTALSGLVGVAVGGGITYRIEQARREHEVERERAAEANAARGVARVWADDFSRALQAVHEAKKAGNMWVAPPGGFYLSDLRHEDRLLLATHLSAEDWNTVAYAHANATLVRGGIADYARQPIDPSVFVVDAAVMQPCRAPRRRRDRRT